MDLTVGSEVDRALDAGDPIVALESTIFSELGLPSPHNREALTRCLDTVREAGAVPALTGIIAGRPSVGVGEELHELVCGPARKVAVRDIGVAVAQQWPYGATTVSASLALSAKAGIEVFATGGIGGVHRRAAETGDISADLGALARYPVVTVSAGAKVFLDLAHTVEYLETASVPVLGWRCDELPAFHAVSSGIRLPHRVEEAAEVAAIAQAHWALGGGGLLVVAPVPAADAVELDEIMAASGEAVARAESDGVVGAGVTPAVLEAMMTLTEGRAITANLSLAANNAAIASGIAVALAES